MQRMFFLLALLLFPAVSEAGGFRGVQVFAAMADAFNAPSPLDVYPKLSACDRTLMLLDKVPYPAMAVLWGSFGDNPECLARFIRKFRDRPHLLQIHFSNETCRPGRAKPPRTCLEGDFLPTTSVADLNRLLATLDTATLDAVTKRTREIAVVVDEINSANTHILLSIGLEDQYSPQAAVVLETHIRNSGWRFGLSRNRVNGQIGVAMSGWMETHVAAGARRPREVKGPYCIYGEDGNTTNLRTSKEVLNKYADCLVVLLWQQWWQNFPPPNGVFIPPRERQFEVLEYDILELGPLLEKAP